MAGAHVSGLVEALLRLWASVVGRHYFRIHEQVVSYCRSPFELSSRRCDDVGGRARLGACQPSVPSRVACCMGVKLGEAGACLDSILHQSSDLALRLVFVTSFLQFLLRFLLGH